ncbi:MAG: twin-arginine translocase subunit TatC [Planctomycetes bacterium]|nr:twin-arginine translocase subunit TatC [Planctomycetota bacterium]
MRELPDNPEDYRMSLGEHLEELRRRIIYALAGVGIVTVLCLVFGRTLVDFVTEPVREAVKEFGAEANLVVLSPTEPFVATMKTAFVIAFVISSPWVFYQMWLFVAAGLYRHERRVVYIFVPFSATLFVAGTVFAYEIVLKYGLYFLLSFGGLVGTIATPTITLSAAISFVMIMSVVMGAIFQLPLVMMILAKVGIVESHTYVENWRYAIVAVFVISAIMTPPDVFTQLAMAGPMIALYWVGVLLSKLVAGPE